MYARGSSRSRYGHAITVPSNAIITANGKPVVHRRRTAAGRAEGGVTRGTGGTAPAAGADAKTMTARLVAVETGIHDGDRVEIISGLKDGARVVTTGAGALKDGDRIVAATGDKGQQGGNAGGRGPQPGSGR